MHKPIYLLFIALGFCSCRQELPESIASPVAVDSTAILTDKQNTLNVGENTSYEIDSSGILMFPLTNKTKERKGSSYISKREYNNYWWNIIFWNSKTGTYHLLTREKILIAPNSNNSFSNEERIALPQPYLFYHVIAEDYNKDKILSEEDPLYLYLSDKNGDAFRRVSPSGYHLISWKFIVPSGKLLMTLRKDSDQNKVFDDKDEITLFAMEPGKEAEAKEIFPGTFKNELKLLHYKHWGQ